MALAKSQAYQDAADATDLANFAAWRAKHGFAAMPALRRQVAAIAPARGIAGQPLDTKRPVIRETLRGIGRKRGAPRPRHGAGRATTPCS